VASYRETHNPATGEWIRIEQGAAETRGELVRYRWRQDPGGRIVEHIHPISTERFIIEAGSTDFTVNGVTRTCGAGEVVDVPVGTPHALHNTGRDPVIGWVEIRPAGLSAELHDTLAGLSSEGLTDETGRPRSLRQLGATFWYFRDDIRVTSIPIWVQNLLLPPLAAIARLTGVEPTYPRWSSRSDEAGQGSQSG
jgi:quercetin dioxygenase-like cupin family protein